MSATILAFDTATTACTAALCQDNQVNELFEIAPRRHSELIIKMIDTLLANADIALQDVDAIAFGCGPGSFMGVRIATGIAQGLAFGSQKPVIPISTLQTLAQSAYQETQTSDILVGWDARMDEVYWGAYHLNESNGLMEATVSDRLDKPRDIKLKVQKEYLAVGNAWALYEASLSEHLKQHITIQSEVIYPQAGPMTKIALEKYQQGDLLSAEKAEPTYLRNKVTNS